MKNSNLIKINLAILTGLLLVSCSKKSSKIDFDFKNLKKPTNISTKNENKKTFSIENNLYIKDLNPLKDKDEILSNIKLGKKDPFSREVNKDLKTNKLYFDLKLTGFVNTDLNKYAIVTYQETEGTLSEESVGGINTNLLPNSAKVLKVDPINKELTIYFENKNFIFKL